VRPFDTSLDGITASEDPQAEDPQRTSPHTALRNVGETIFLNISAIRLTYPKNMSFSDWYLTGELGREGRGG
jgi:hypothetical protein